MPTPTSAQRRSFEKCQGWVCNVCPTIDRGQPNVTTVHDHEHARGGDGIHKGQIAVHEACWDKMKAPLTSEGLRQWEMHAHVDHVFDLVPFWQRGMDAAEKGEVLRMEEFLEQMEGDGGWRTANEVLGMLGGWKVQRAGDERETGWGQMGGWGVNSARVASDVTETSHSDGRAVRGELRDFVDAIARQEAVTENRRREMHMFLEMPVEQQIQKIHETIRVLRTCT